MVTLHFTSHQPLWLLESLELRNRQLLKPAKRWGTCEKDNRHLIINNRHILTQTNLQNELTRQNNQNTMTGKKTTGNLTFPIYFSLQTISLILFFFIVAPRMLFGQQKNVGNGNQQWLQYYNQTKLNDKWTLLFDGGYRLKDGFQESSQYIVRAAIGYNINSDIRISSGLAHLGFYSSDKINKVEFRPYQEMTVNNKFNKIGLVHRYRMEERFFNPVTNGEIQTPNTFNFRFRYSLMLSIPLFKLSKAKTDKEFLINFGDEIFINAGKNVVNNIFDQNRFIVSPSFRLNENLTLSLTWNSQFASTSSQAIFNYTNVFWLQIKHKLNIRKKQKE